MRGLRKIFICTLVVGLAFLVNMTSALAIDSTAGSSVEVAFNYSGITGIDGTVTVNDPNEIIESYKIIGHTFGSNTSFITTDTGIILNSTDGSSFSGAVKVIVTLKEKAKIGDSATISLTGHTSDNDLNLVKNGANQTQSVVVADVKESNNSTPNKPTTSNPNGSNSNSSDETIEGVDYSKLQDAIESANTLINADNHAKLWQALFNALQNGNNVLLSNDQEAVDLATEQLLKAIEAIKSMESTDAINSSNCSISMHKVWPILFFISLAVNGVFVFGVIREKRNKFVDNIPVVDYDINEDDDSDDEQ